MSPLDSLLNDPEYQHTVERIARKYTKTTAIAWQDAAQAAHLKVMQALQAGKFHRPGNLHHWAFTVATLEIIDLVRKEMRNTHASLDRFLPGTNLPLMDTIASDLNLPDAVERADLVLRIRDAIAELDRQHPDRGYLLLWQGLVKNHKQMAIAVAMGISQGEVAKRRRELAERIAIALKLIDPPLNLHRSIRNRSNQRW